MSAAPVVAIYRTQILPLSETFVRDQALALRRWRPVLVGEREINALSLDGLAVAARHVGAPTLAQRFAGLTARQFDRPPPGVAGIVRRTAPNLIHAHFGFDGVEAWPVARRLGIPLLVTLHGSDITTRMDWFEQGRAGRRWKDYPRRLARLAQQRQACFIAVSENIRQAALDAGVPDEKIFVRPIGVDMSRFGPSGQSAGSRARSILFLGRLVEKKGCSILLDAFAAIRRQIPDAELVVAGDGPERSALETRASGLQGVRFVGAVDHQAVRSLLAQTRVFCLPSITAPSGDAEGLPLVILEAQASGVPVVTSARGGATEGILDGVTGYAFAEHDVATLVDRLTRLLTDDVLADRFAKAAPAFIGEHHSLQRCTIELEDVYDHVTARGA